MASSKGKDHAPKRIQSNQEFLKPPEDCLFKFSNPSDTRKTKAEYTEKISWTVDELRKALIQYVSTCMRYSPEVAENMTITDVKESFSYHYILESFEEKRQTNLRTKPYMIGDVVESPSTPDYDPDPWGIPLKVHYFKDKTDERTIPQTSNVRVCGHCTYLGETCSVCYGHKRILCVQCHGTSHRYNENRCSKCHGFGHIKCRECDGEGVLKCPACKASRRIVVYIELTTIWKNHVDEYILNGSSMQEHFIKTAEGQCVFQESDYKVKPIEDFNVDEINQASARLVKKHRMDLAEKLILKQRQTIRIVPVVKVEYTWKDTKSSFFVYGQDKKVYAPNYRLSFPIVESLFTPFLKK